MVLKAALAHSKKSSMKRISCQEGTTAPPPNSHKAYKTTKRAHKKGPAKNKEHEKHRQKSEHDVFDHTQNQCKTCPKTKKIMDPAKSTEKNTKIMT
jgi:hypothetical protein